MILIATQDIGLALQIGETISGERWYLTHADDGDDLRRRICEAEPSVLVLDVTVGGNSISVLTEAQTVMRELPALEVVLLLPWRSPSVETWASKIGIFDVLSLDQSAFWDDLGRCVADAEVAVLGAPRQREQGRDGELVH